MTVFAIGFDAARYDAMDTTVNITGIGGGAGAGVEADIAYQNALAISRKVTGGGFYTDLGGAQDVTTTGRATWMVKIWLTNYGSLSTPGNKLEARVGSATSAYYSYIFGSPTISYPSKGGFIVAAVNPSIAAHRSGTTGSPTLTASDYFAAYADCSSSKEANIVLDSIDFVYGLYVTGGTGADPDAAFDDIVAADEGTLTARYGMVTTDGDTVKILGRLVYGATTASGVRTSAAVGFAATGSKITFPENKAAAGFSGFVLDLTVVGTSVSWTRCTFSSEGTIAGEDTRAVLDAIGTTSTVGLLSTLCSFTAFASVNLTSKCSITGATFTSCGQIACGDGATLSDSGIINSTAASALLWDTASDPNGELDNLSFTSSGVGHAIELGVSTPSAITLTGHTYTGYAGTNGTTGNEVLYNNSGKLITISVSGGASPTIRNGVGASTVVDNPVSITLTGIDPSARVVIVEDDATRLVLADGFPNGSGEFTYSYNYVTDQPVDIGIYGLDNKVTEFVDTLTNTTRSFPVSQIADLVYLNPV